MGFGTSGSLLLIFAALFLALSGLYTATANTAEDMTTARDAQSELHRTVLDTSINVTATWDAAAANLTIQVNNTGETTLTTRDVDVLVDGTYVTIERFDRREVDGEPTNVWRPGEQFVLEEDDELTARPDRVKVVTGPGVADIDGVVS